MRKRTRKPTFSIQAFLVTALLRSAQRLGIPAEEAELRLEVAHGAPDDAEPEPPQGGTRVRGLFLSACRWDAKQGALAEPEPQALYSECPVLCVLARSAEEVPEARPGAHYECPIYVVPSRPRSAAAAARSTWRNLLCSAALGSEAAPHHWALRGAAATSQLEG